MFNPDSAVTRYVLVELELPDGSGYSPDPEAEHSRIRRDISAYLSHDPTADGFTVTNVEPGHVVGAEDGLPVTDDLRDAVHAAARAADGDSNDDEIDRLREALDEALMLLGTSYDDLTEGIDDEQPEEVCALQAKRGTGTGVCLGSFDEHGQCSRSVYHLE